MKKKQRNYRSTFLSPLCILLLTPFLSLPAQAGPYTDSAHGDSSPGVQRNSTALMNYSKSNCAHCHEQHASIDGSEPVPLSENNSASPFALFANNFDSTAPQPYLQSDNFCFYCHTNVSSLQSGGLDNMDYAATFGGYTTSSPLGIFEAFNQYSFHNLHDIWDFSKDKFNKDSANGFFTSLSNPCTGCHNPHLAKPNKRYPQDPTYTAISKPSDHTNLWGDVASERMDAATSNNYMAPYFSSTSGTPDTSSYEPAEDSQNDGRNTPDYNAFCTDCHNTINTIYSTTLGRDLVKISWYIEGGDTVTAGDKHGKNSATGASQRIAPYGTSNGWILSCLDCHEPHGSPNAYLIRREVNGSAISGNIREGSSNMELLCAKCHDNNWEYIHHTSEDGLYDQFKCGTCHGHSTDPTFTIPCENCHAHGMSVVDEENPSLIRRTF